MLRRLFGLCVTVLAIWHSDLGSSSPLQSFWLPLLAVLAGLFTLLCDQAFAPDGECGLAARRRARERQGSGPD